MTMLRTRVIPCLQLFNEGLVKTIRFKNHSYIGDPINTVRIFNELEVDELVFLDISASKVQRPPNYDVIRNIADECFMPVAYGGGIQSLEHAKRVFDLGVEKVIVNTAASVKPDLIWDIAGVFGSQAVVLAIDVKKSIWGRYESYTQSGKLNTKQDPCRLAREAEQHGAGEILLTSIDREGTWKGFDIDLIKGVSASTHLPVIAHGGAGRIEDIGVAITVGKASAVALGSMVVYQGQNLGVLVNFPDKNKLKSVLSLDEDFYR